MTLNKSENMPPAQANIIICRCRDYARVDKKNTEQIINALKKRRVNLIELDDLCGTLACDPNLIQPHLTATSLTFAACAPAAVRSLLFYAKLNYPKARFLDITEPNPSLPENLTADLPKGTPSHHIIPYNHKWTPWYPVIDPKKCKNCGQCLNFCLFGVYQSSEDKKVKVERPSACKTNCPACSRVCPENAVIFPKHADPIINGTTQNKNPEKKLKIKNTDIYKSLRSRDSSNIDQLKNDLSIPDSVINNLTADQLKNITKKSGPSK